MLSLRIGSAFSVPGAEGGSFTLQSLMFADWKTAALDSSEVMKHAEVIFEMTSQ